MKHVRHVTKVATPAVAAGPSIIVDTKGGCDAVPPSAQKSCKTTVKFGGAFEYEM